MENGGNFSPLRPAVSAILHLKISIKTRETLLSQTRFRVRLPGHAKLLRDYEAIPAAHATWVAAGRKARGFASIAL
jgi:hypothetical protein